MQPIDRTHLANPPNVECKGTINFCGNTIKMPWTKSDQAPSGPPKAPASGAPAPMPQGRP
jgi:hypothetical protein